MRRSRVTEYRHRLARPGSAFLLAIAAAALLRDSRPLLADTSAIQPRGITA